MFDRFRTHLQQRILIDVEFEVLAHYIDKALDYSTTHRRVRRLHRTVSNERVDQVSVCCSWIVVVDH